jgi:hypothetical protein
MVSPKKCPPSSAVVTITGAVDRPVRGMSDDYSWWLIVNP